MVPHSFFARHALLFDLLLCVGWHAEQEQDSEIGDTCPQLFVIQNNFTPVPAMKYLKSFHW